MNTNTIWSSSKKSLIHLSDIFDIKLQVCLHFQQAYKYIYIFLISDDPTYLGLCILVACSNFSLPFRQPSTTTNPVLWMWMQGGCPDFPRLSPTFPELQTIKIALWCACGNWLGAHTHTVAAVSCIFRIISACWFMQQFRVFWSIITIRAAFNPLAWCPFGNNTTVLKTFN